MLLQEHYNERSKVEALIALGDISFLDVNIEPTGKHTFNDPEDSVTVAYHRDRGEDFNSKTYPNVVTLFENDAFDAVTFPVRVKEPVLVPNITNTASPPAPFVPISNVFFVVFK
jgi:hypothetical protein